MLVSLTSKMNAQSASADTKTDNHTVTIDIPEVAILDIEPSTNKNLNLKFTAPTEAGEKLVAPAADKSLWLNYSSIKTSTGPDNVRTVSVKLNTPVPGVDIKVTAAAYSGNGAGTFGVPASTLTLTSADQTILTGIGSAYTGNGVNNGHNLQYDVAVGGTGTGATGYSSIVANTTAAAIVTYTISDN
jgi:hypothetical protein